MNISKITGSQENFKCYTLILSFFDTTQHRVSLIRSLFQENYVALSKVKVCQALMRFKILILSRKMVSSTSSKQNSIHLAPQAIIITSEHPKNETSTQRSQPCQGQGISPKTWDNDMTGNSNQQKKNDHHELLFNQ